MPYTKPDRKSVLRSLERTQRGRCLICRRRGKVVQGGGLVLDHCHRTGRPRAILCTGCNSALGMARESPLILEALAVYALACNTHAQTEGTGHDIDVRSPYQEHLVPTQYVEAHLTPEQKARVAERVRTDPSLRGRL